VTTVNRDSASAEYNAAALDAAVSLIEATAAPTAAPTGFKPPAPSKTSPVGAIVGSVVGVLVAAALAYVAWRKRDALKRLFSKDTPPIVGKSAVATSTTNTNTDGDHQSDVVRRESESGVGHSITDSLATDARDVELGKLGTSKSTTGSSAGKTAAVTQSQRVPAASGLAGSSSDSAAVERPFTKQLVQGAVAVTSGISSVAQSTLAKHGHTLLTAHELVGAVAEHLPYVNLAYGLFSEIIDLFAANAHIGENCAEVVSCATDMQVCHCIYYKI
jgi:hypothetical protein